MKLAYFPSSIMLDDYKNWFLKSVIGRKWVKEGPFGQFEIYMHVFHRDVPDVHKKLQTLQKLSVTMSSIMSKVFE